MRDQRGEGGAGATPHRLRVSAISGEEVRLTSKKLFVNGRFTFAQADLRFFGELLREIAGVT